MDDGGSVATKDDHRSVYQYDFFISYTHGDQAWAEWIAWHLEAAVRSPGRRLQVLLQAWDFVPGTNWVVKMQEGAQQAERVMPVLSPRYLADSRFGASEWQAIWRADPDGAQRRTVPVRVADCEPPGLLGGIVYIDLVGVDEPTATEKLLAGIQGTLTGRSKPEGKPRWPGDALAPPVPTSAHSKAARARPEGPGQGDDPSVTVLHLSDLRFGAHHAFGSNGLTQAHQAHVPLLGRLHDDLAHLAKTEGLHPDLVVATGDLTETGASAEFNQMGKFLTALAEKLHLGRNRFAVIPGDRDVNKKKCHSYFLDMEAEGADP
jgi:TIR domain